MRYSHVDKQVAKELDLSSGGGGGGFTPTVTEITLSDTYLRSGSYIQKIEYGNLIILDCYLRFKGAYFLNNKPLISSDIVKSDLMTNHDIDVAASRFDMNDTSYSEAIEIIIDDDGIKVYGDSAVGVSNTYPYHTQIVLMKK